MTESQFGVSYGNRQAVPARLRTGGCDKLIEQLRSSKPLERIANYADGKHSNFNFHFLMDQKKTTATFQLWSPKLYSYYQGYTQAMEEMTGEHHNYPGSIFVCASHSYLMGHIFNPELAVLTGAQRRDTAMKVIE